MEELNELGFKNTSIIAYNETSQPYNGLKVDKNTFKIKDYSSDSRFSVVKAAFTGHFRHGRHLPDNKIAFHNHGGKLQEQPYREFKDQYMRNEQRIENSIKELSEAQEEIIYLQNILFQSVAPYLDNYEQSFYHGYFNRHGSNGHKRVKYFCVQINSISTESIVNNEISPENAITQIINEIKSFASRSGGYTQYSGRINVNNNSGMTFIMKGLLTFHYLLGQIESSKLKDFINIRRLKNMKYFFERRDDYRKYWILGFLLQIFLRARGFNIFYFS
jgi:hypothetical protein